MEHSSYTNKIKQKEPSVILLLMKIPGTEKVKNVLTSWRSNCVLAISANDRLPFEKSVYTESNAVKSRQS